MPGVFIGSFLSNFSAFINYHNISSCIVSILAISGIAVGTTLGTFVGVFLLRKYVKNLNILEKPINVFKFLGFTGLLAPVINASFGVTSLLISGKIALSSYLISWIIWYVSNVAGTFTLTPFIITLYPKNKTKMKNNLDGIKNNFWEILERIILIIIVFFLGKNTFWGQIPAAYMLIPCLMWAAFRFQHLFVTSLILIVTAIAIFPTVRGLGIFGTQNITQSLILLQSFIMVVALTTLVLTATLKENQLRLDQLMQKTSELEDSELTIKQQFERGLILREITQKIRNSLDKNQIIQTTVKQLGKILNVSRCLIYIYIEDTTPYLKLMSEYLQPEYMSIAGLKLEINNYTYLQILLNQDNAIAVKNVYTESSLKNAEDWFRQVEVKSLLAVRTSYNSKVNGVISLQQCDRFKEWQYEEIEILESVAEQVGIALAQAKMLETEREQKEQLERQNQDLILAKQLAESANKSKSQFLANMSHEIRTPLNAIVGFANLLKPTITDAKKISYLDSITVSGNTLLTLINDLLDLSKIEANKLTIEYVPVNIRLIIQEMDKIFTYTAQEKGILLEWKVENLPDIIQFDQIRLRQILLNMIGNAIKFTEQGNIKIFISAQTEDKNHVKLTIIIADTGVGIAKHQQEKIFDAFVQSEGQSTRKYGGTGLGLAITKRLTEMLSGTIQLESELNKGSKFTFVFSQVEILSDFLSDKILNEDIDLEQFSQLKIMIINDTPGKLELIKDFFITSKHQLILAEDGQSAREIVKINLPDVILIDLSSELINVIKTIEIMQLDQQLVNVPYITIIDTSIIYDHNLPKLDENNYLSKPVTRGKLVSALKIILPKTQNFSNQLVNISSVTIINLPELLAKLYDQQQTIWLELCQTMKMRDIRKFAQDLEELSNTHQCLQLLDYVNQLSTNINNFDLEKLPATIAIFPEIVRLIESVH